jgi:hypothetical protein
MTAGNAHGESAHHHGCRRPPGVRLQETPQGFGQQFIQIRGKSCFDKAESEGRQLRRPFSVNGGSGHDGREAEWKGRPVIQPVKGCGIGGQECPPTVCWYRLVGLAVGLGQPSDARIPETAEKMEETMQ